MVKKLHFGDGDTCQEEIKNIRNNTEIKIKCKTCIPNNKHMGGVNATMVELKLKKF